MTPVQWDPIVYSLKVAAHPSGLWTVALPYISGPGVLKVIASGSWFYAKDHNCGPDGDQTSFISPQNCLAKAGLTGALIGKIGGGNADLAGLVFVAGSFCTVIFDEKQSGALFFSINDEIAGMDDNSGDVTVDVFLKH
jgi:hypothetical protein